MNRLLKFSFAAALVALIAAPAFAHHSFAMYDMTKTQVATGKLIRFVPGANHAQLIFEVLDPAGKTVMKGGKAAVIQVETGSAAQLARQGVTVQSFPIGTVTFFNYHPLRDGRPAGALAGQLIMCGTALPKGGCSKTTGQEFLTGSAQ